MYMYFSRWLGHKGAYLAGGCSALIHKSADWFCRPHQSPVTTLRSRSGAKEKKRKRELVFHLLDLGRNCVFCFRSQIFFFFLDLFEHLLWEWRAVYRFSRRLCLFKHARNYTSNKLPRFALSIIHGCYRCHRCETAYSRRVSLVSTRLSEQRK